MQTMCKNFLLFCTPTWRQCKPPIEEHFLMAGYKRLQNGERSASTVACCKTWTGFVKTWTGFVKHGFVKGGFVKHGFVKGHKNIARVLRFC